MDFPHKSGGLVILQFVLKNMSGRMRFEAIPRGRELSRSHTGGGPVPRRVGGNVILV
jgi:hypothetical protein